MVSEKTKAFEKYLRFDEILTIRKQSDRISAFEGEKEIFEIRISEKSSKLIFNILLNENFDIISPLYSLNNRQYEINYPDFYKAGSELVEFSNIIIKFNGFYLVINAEFSNYYYFKINKKDDLTIVIAFDAADRAKLNFKYFKCLTKYYSGLKMDNGYPLWIYNPGVIIDYSQVKDSSINYTELKSLTGINNINILIKNWESPVILLKNNDNIENFISLINKLKLNGINYIFHYDNTIPCVNSDRIPVIRTRSGNPSLNSVQRAFIDFYNSSGKIQLSCIYQDIMNMNAKGFYLDSAFLCLNDPDVYYKSVCKTENSLVPYYRNMKYGLKLLNKMLDEIILNNNGAVFFSNIASESFKNTVFLMNTKNKSLNDIFFNFYDLLSQGYINFGFNITDESNLKILLLLLVCPIIFIDRLIIYRIIDNYDYKEKFYKILKKRSCLKMFIYNLYDKFAVNGIFPFKYLMHDKNIDGIYAGYDVFISFLNFRILEPYFVLPEGKWFLIDDKIHTEGNSVLSDRENSGLFKIMLKKGGILIEQEDSNFSGINVYIYPCFDQKRNSADFKEQIMTDNASSIRFHQVSYTLKNGLLSILYKTDETIKRKINFIIAFKDLKVNNILSDEKRILYKTDKAGNYIEFKINNNNDTLNVDISF